MLNKMRESAGSWMIKILLGLVVLAFVFMGAGSFNAGRVNRAATVNGEPVPIKDYQQAYQGLVDRLREQFGEQLDNDMLEMFDLKRQAMDRVIEAELMRQKADAYNIRVSSEELAESIKQAPIFQHKGQFSPRLYQAVLGKYRLTSLEFEDIQREDLLLAKLEAMLASGIQVSDDEARKWYNWQNKEIKIDYIHFAASDYADFSISDEALEAYYKEHKADYRTDPKIKVRYVRFDPSAYMDSVEVPEEDIFAYYEENSEQFTEKATVKARQILLEVPEDAGEETVSEKQEEARELAEEARAGKDFAELAKAHSEGPNKENGGDLGTFTRNERIAPLSKAAFALQPGEVSGPVRSKLGWHIIKVEEKSEEKVKPLEEAKEGIRKTLASQRAKNVAYEKAVSMYNTSFSGDDLVENTRGRDDVSVETTGFFTRRNGAREAPNPSKFSDIAFDLPLMEVSDVVEMGDAFYLLQVTEKQDAEIPSFDEVRESVRTDLERQMQNEAATEAAAEFLEKASSAASLRAAAEDAALELQTTEFFTRNQSIPGIGNAPAIVEAAFGLTESKALPEKPLEGPGGYYVIAFSESKLPDEQEFLEAKDRVRDELSGRKYARFMGSLIDRMRDAADIEITRELIN
jgi:peptidyl-prolyl cis-trans isomerase D